jgi:hypothetical protein
LPVETVLRLVIWLGIGICIYFAFGYRYSVMRNVEMAGSDPSVPRDAPFRAANSAFCRRRVSISQKIR